MKKTKSLAIALRPRRFSRVIGQDELLKTIRSKVADSTRTAWMFSGPTGSGKTTLARIMAVSYNCTHQEQFGEPCDDCLSAKSSFAIQEINASDVSGVNEIGPLVKGAGYEPPEPSKKRIYILDEAQRLSSAAQNMLLKPFEDSPETTIWFICTTERHKILNTLQRRCCPLETRGLDSAGITKLVNRALQFKDVKFTPPQLVNELLEVGIQSPGLILNAVENFISGMSAKEAVRSLSIGYNTKAICRSLLKGDWVEIRKEIKDATPDDLRGIRAQVAGYLRGILMEEVPGPVATEAAKAIDILARVDAYTDIAQGPATASALYQLCQHYKGPQVED